jgi:hypothetical protein
MNIGIKANTSMAQNASISIGRNNFDVKAGKQKINSRSNTIENVAPFEKDSKKSVKRKERASSTLEPSEMQPNQNYIGIPTAVLHQHHNS